MNNHVALLDLKAANAPMQAEIEEALLRVARSGRYLHGPEVEAFEAEWAAYCGVEHCVAVGNCSDALRLILTASEIGSGEVIVPSNTYIATWLSVTHAGLKVVPVEPDCGRYRSGYNIDPEAVEAAIGPETKAIVAVHLYGQPADMETLGEIAADHGLLLLEDAAQAHGARHYSVDGWRKAGALGDAAAWSFYPSKNLGALGDAGAVTTNHTDIADKVRRLRNYGGVGREDHTLQGWNSRMDELQAAVLRAKLPHLDSMNQRRRQRAAVYRNELLRSSVSIPESIGDPVHHQFVVRSYTRDHLQAALAGRGIEAHVHYPVPPHLEPAYRYDFDGPGSFPIAEQLAREVLSLPIGNDVDVRAIAAAVLEISGDERAAA